MLARRRVEAGVSKLQTRYRLAAHDMGLDDFLDIGGGHVAVPDGVGVNHDGRPVFALVETSRFVRADCDVSTGFGETGLEGALQVAGTAGVTATPGMVLGTLVAADKNVLGELGHQRVGRVLVEENGPRCAARSGT